MITFSPLITSRVRCVVVGPVQASSAFTPKILFPGRCAPYPDSTMASAAVNAAGIFVVCCDTCAAANTELKNACCADVSMSSPLIDFLLKFYLFEPGDTPFTDLHGKTDQTRKQANAHTSVAQYIMYDRQGFRKFI